MMRGSLVLILPVHFTSLYGDGIIRLDINGTYTLLPLIWTVLHFFGPSILRLLYPDLSHDEMDFYEK